MRASSPYGSIRSSPSTDPDLLDRRADRPEGLIAPRLVRQHRRPSAATAGRGSDRAGAPPTPFPPQLLLRQRAHLLERARQNAFHPIALPRSLGAPPAWANPRHAPEHQENRAKLLDPAPHEPMRTVAPGSRHRLPCPSASPAGIGLDARASGCARVIIGSTRSDQLRPRRRRAHPAPNALSSPSPDTNWSHLGRSPDP